MTGGAAVNSPYLETVAGFNQTRVEHVGEITCTRDLTSLCLYMAGVVQCHVEYVLGKSGLRVIAVQLRLLKKGKQNKIKMTCPRS